MALAAFQLRKGIVNISEPAELILIPKYVNSVVFSNFLPLKKNDTL